MSNVDQFESAFRSAIRPTYEPHSISLKRVLWVTDLNEGETAAYIERHQSSLPNHALESRNQWQQLSEKDYRTTGELLEQVDQQRPDVICTYRNLNTEDWQFELSIGSRLDTLVSKSPYPVLVLPHPATSPQPAANANGNATVIALTDHLTEDHKLIDYSVSFLARPGSLVLVHLEDQDTFDRYLSAIGHITTIDTTNAEETLRHQLLKEPHTFISTCRERLADSEPQIQVKEIVEFARGIQPFHQHINNEAADLVVINGIDHDQPGIHGLAQRLMNETRQRPIPVL